MTWISGVIIGSLYILGMVAFKSAFISAMEVNRFLGFAYLHRHTGRFWRPLAHSARCKEIIAEMTEADVKKIGLIPFHPNIIFWLILILWPIAVLLAMLMLSDKKEDDEQCNLECPQRR